MVNCGIKKYIFSLFFSLLDCLFNRHLLAGRRIKPGSTLPVSTKERKGNYRTATPVGPK
jgi:hypothetical protein